MAEEPTPQVELTWDVMWCARHLEPFRTEWPKGAGIAMVKLFEAAVAMPAIGDAAGCDVGQLGKALERFAPVCCFIDRDDLLEIYAAAGVEAP